jgi:SAM-dependent methyltransferase
MRRKAIIRDFAALSLFGLLTRAAYRLIATPRDWTDTTLYRAAGHSLLQSDVTNLSAFPDASFDFVASYGVLHHTPDCIGGLKEHFRILKPGGTLWLYLYGAGGMYWPVYDRLRDIVGRFAIADVKRSLQKLGIREGLIYTYLDNVLAPRTYHTESEIIEVLRQADPGVTYSRAKGGSVIDDTNKVLASKYGPSIVGPEGEVRLVIRRSW